MALQDVIDLVRALNPEELRQLRTMLDASAGDGERDSGRAALHSAILAAGLVKVVKHPSASSSPRRLVRVEGAPLSQTIREERR